MQERLELTASSGVQKREALKLWICVASPQFSASLLFHPPPPLFPKAGSWSYGKLGKFPEEGGKQEEDRWQLGKGGVGSWEEQAIQVPRWVEEVAQPCDR